MIEPFDHKSRKYFPQGRGRFLIFVSLFSLAAMTVFVRYAVLMLNPPNLGRSSPGQVLGERGPILDRNGRILAIQTRLGNISVWRPEIADTGVTARELAPILNMPEDDIRNRIDLSPSDFLYLKKQVDQSTLREIEEAKAQGRLRGVNIEPVVGRIYPEKRLASQIIGFVGNENKGLAGIEYAFESELAPAGENLTGRQVILTIDANVQHILEGIAEKAMVENKAEAVMLLAMDPRSGDILGSASLPDFDPNDIRSSDEISRMDRPAIWAYEPGSVFKIFSLAALLDERAITEDSTFICNGRYEHVTNLGERIVINCLGAHGPVRAREIIITSCNAGAAYASERIGSAAFYELLRDFGFGARTGAGNPGETAGFLRPVDRWSQRSKPTISMGQEIAVSAMQMIQAATAVANDGILVPPRIVSQIVSEEGKIPQPYKSGTPRRIIQAETAQTMRRYMAAVSSDIGTGWRANVEDLSLAVKTGTAQIIDPETGAYSETDFIASCIALLPAEAPSLILYLAIVKPQGASYLGGRIAAPAIREAAEALIDYLGIPRGRNPQVSHSGTISIPTEEVLVVGDRVPDFTGYSKRRLLPLLLRDDLRIEINGEGWVRRQNPPPGSPLAPGDTIILELE
ncbi:MAG: PASTA domain-containing protein [Spirochaetaceae bacterium]|jgi:cell division protein FtsI (penicillin-binding protein 3)|nr:PASTA domain-containing protein [Spirochaetaceae bacterium]